VDVCTSRVEAKSVQNCSLVCAITTMWREKKYNPWTYAHSIASLPICAGCCHCRGGFEEAIVTRDQVVTDVVTKTVYFSLALAAFAFVSMLLLTGLHP
jgi:predicted ferric reductase